ncbi:hypothetical protein scyTo_0020253, partial [Scyliorhinus torazame]|nr:hypothetical protein [Scyliorhinus torazame]
RGGTKIGGEEFSRGKELSRLNGEIAQAICSMAKPFDDGNASDPHAQEHIPREVQCSLANCTAIPAALYSPLPLAHAHSFRHQGQYCNRSLPAAAVSCRGSLTCGMDTTADSPLSGGSRQIQSAMPDGSIGSSLTTQDRDSHQEMGDDEAIIRQIGIQLRQMADQLHTYHMERVVEWDRRHWPFWYWTFLNFFMHTLAIFPVPRWR